jgi:hypothetical protein
MIDYNAILVTKYSGAEFVVNSQGTITYWKHSSAQPTKAQMDKMWPEVDAREKNRVSENNRHNAYIKEADPLYMYWQAGEGTKDAWLAKRAEIRKRFPYVAVPS